MGVFLFVRVVEFVCACMFMCMCECRCVIVCVLCVVFVFCGCVHDIVYGCDRACVWVRVRSRVVSWGLCVLCVSLCCVCSVCA